MKTLIIDYVLFVVIVLFMCYGICLGDTIGFMIGFGFFLCHLSLVLKDRYQH